MVVKKAGLPVKLKTCRRKNTLWTKYLESKLEEDKVKYKLLSNRLKALCRLAKTQHFEKKVSSKHSSRTLFHLAKDIRNDQNKNRSILLSCDKLNDLFVNIGLQLANKEVCQDYLRHVKTVTNTLFLQKTNYSELYKIINSLPNKSSEDCYGLSSLLLKVVNPVVCDLLADQFNRCIDESEFPEVLKLAKVLPFHKSGDRNDAGNFRPISLLPINKVFEKLLFKRIEDFLNVNRLLSPSQFGFRSKRSTIVAVAEVVEFLRTNRNLRTPSSCTFIDLTKAFDTVDHDILLKKCYAYGLREKTFSTFLANRSQYVKIKNQTSFKKAISIGVPQGSVLGPLLFLLYINDLPAVCQHSKVTMFADDTNVYATAHDLNILNKDMTNVVNWMSANKLTVNFEKKNIVVFNKNEKQNSNKLTIGQKTIESKDTAKYLGIHIDKQLNFRKHIKMVKQKLQQITSSLFQLKRFFQTENYGKTLQSLCSTSNSLWGSYLWVF